jgi:hypothetical protein
MANQKIYQVYYDREVLETFSSNDEAEKFVMCFILKYINNIIRNAISNNKNYYTHHRSNIDTHLKYLDILNETKTFTNAILSEYSVGIVEQDILEDAIKDIDFPEVYENLHNYNKMITFQ